MERGRKVMLDMSWERLMQEYAEVEGMPAGYRNATINRIAREREMFPRGDNSFNGLFTDELHGCLDAIFPHIENSLLTLARAVGVQTAGARQIGEPERRMWINMFREAMVRGFDLKAIPSLRVRAALHAAIRMDDRRPFRRNDIADIDHSSVAVAYCDVFLTERSFAELLRRSAVQNVCIPKCRVISEIGEAITFIERVCK